MDEEKTHLITVEEAKELIGNFADQHPHRTKVFTFFNDDEIDLLLAESGDLDIYMATDKEGNETIVAKRGKVLLEKAAGCPPNCYKSYELLVK